MKVGLREGMKRLLKCKKIFKTSYKGLIKVEKYKYIIITIINLKINPNHIKLNIFNVKSFCNKLYLNLFKYYQVIKIMY
jgi:hypothetical protein